MKIVFFNIVFLIELFIIIVKKGECQQYKNQYSIQNELTYQFCDISSSTGYKYYTGSQIFANSNAGSNKVDKLSITGWYFLRGYNNTYSLFSVKINNNNLFSVEYETTSKYLKSTLLSQATAIQSSALLKNSWYFICATAEKQVNHFTLILTVLSAEMIILYDSPPAFSANTGANILKSNVIVNIGNAFSNSQFHQSCSFTRNIMVYWDFDIDFQYISYKNDILSLSMNLVYNYDFFYSNVNAGSIFNVQKPMSVLKTPMKRLIPFEIQPTEYFFTDHINALKEFGFVVTFHFKIKNNNSFTTINLLQIIEGSLNINLIKSGNVIEMNGYKIAGVDFNYWIQLTLIIKQQINYKVYLIAKGYENQFVSTLMPSFRTSQIKFGSVNNNETILINYLRIYEGTFLTTGEGNGCSLQASRENISCVQCDSNKLINYSKNINCLASSIINTSNEVNDVLDKKSQNSCLKEMIKDPLTDQCVCRYQFYRQGDQCLKCPNYCRGCTDLQNCIEKDPIRRANGTCPSAYFDDGYSCLKDKFKIKNRVNLVKQFNIDMMDQCKQSVSSDDYRIKQDVLQIGSGAAFFFSFTFKSYLPDFQNAGIWFYKDGTRELFSILFNREQEAYVKFLVDGQTKFKALVNNDEVMWIAVWTDLINATFIVYSNSQLNYHTFKLNISYTLNQPFITLGYVNTQYDTTYYCGNYKHRPFIFIKHMHNPIIEINEVINLLSLEQQVLSYFQTDINQTYSLGYIQDDVSGKKLDFLGTGLVVDKLKGIEYTSSTKSKIDGLQLQQRWLTFSCQITIDELQFQASLISYSGVPTGQKVEYFIVPAGTNAYIRICFYSTCSDTSYAMLKMNQGNTLYIIARNRAPFSPDITYYEFDVVCNYQRESLKFINKIITLDTTETEIFIGDQQKNSGDMKIYLNNIRFDLGDGYYYFSYNNSTDNCFLYTNLSQMSCLIPKQGLVSYKNIYITEQECLTMSKFTNTIHILNKYQRTCTESIFDAKLCSEIDLSSPMLKCSKCALENADINNNCLCSPGTYADNIWQSCMPCSSKCLTCENKSDECLVCKESNQIPPDCKCENENQYLDSNNICQDCSDRCIGCEFTSDSCIYCSENRIDPPFCNCQPINFLDKITFCELMNCNDNCQGCIGSPEQCYKCNTGRVNPPECLCENNYIDNLDGTCSPCPDSTFFDQLSQSCQSCQYPCIKCSNKSDQCTECENDQFLEEQTCNCKTGKSYAAISDKSLVCLENMEVQFQLILKNDLYYLQFEFDYDLKSINFSQFPINKLLSLYISEIPEKYYSLSEPKIDNNILLIKLTLARSISASTGSVQFLQNRQFLSKSERYVLSETYIKKPMQFDIGPFIFDEETMSTQVMGDLTNTLKNQNSGTLKAAQSTQFLFYFLNTAQPTLLFLLLNLQFPPNLYSFYQVLGIFVYPDVVDYQVKQYKQNFNFIGFELDKNEAQLIDEYVYKRLGFSNSFLINAQIIIMKYFFIAILLLIFRTIMYFQNSPEMNQLIESNRTIQNYDSTILNRSIFQIKDNKQNNINNYSFLSKKKQIQKNEKDISYYFQQTDKIDLNITKNKKSKIKQISDFLLQKINSENEANLLIITVSILLQGSVNDENKWTIRYGYYLSIIFIIILVSSFYQNLKEINSEQNKNKLQFSEIYTSRLNMSMNTLYRNYFLIQMIKKYLVIFILIGLRNYPLLACIANGVIFLSSSALTFKSKPYQSLISRIVKILSDFLMSLSWFLHIGIYCIENNLFNSSIMDDDLIQKYLQLGTAIMISLLTFNILYLLEYFIQFCIFIVQKIKQMGKTKETIIQPTKSNNKQNNLNLSRFHKQNTKQQKLKKSSFNENSPDKIAKQDTKNDASFSFS